MKENVRHEVGCPGELVYTASDIHHRHAYIGSHPLFPRANGKLVLPQEKLLTCTRCRDPLYLALYVSVPTVKSTNIRILVGFLYEDFYSLCLFPSSLKYTRFLSGNARFCIYLRALKRVAVMRSSAGKHYGIPWAHLSNNICQLVPRMPLQAQPESNRKILLSVIRGGYLMWRLKMRMNRLIFRI